MRNRIVVFLRDKKHTIIYKFVILYSIYNNSFMIRYRAKKKNIEEPKFSEIPYIRILMYDLNNKVTAYTYKNV